MTTNHRTFSLSTVLVLAFFLTVADICVAAGASAGIDYSTLRLTEEEIEHDFYTASSHPDVKRLLLASRDKWRTLIAMNPEDAAGGPSAEELAAIDFYKGNEGYSDMNRLLRGQQTELFSDDLLHAAIRLTASGLNKFPSAHIHEGIVYRGVQLPPHILDAYTVGAVVEEHAFTSTSVSSTGADRFAFGAEPPRRSAMFTIHSTNGSLIAMYLQCGDTAPGIDVFEAEVLFVPGTRFRVTDRSEDEYGYVNIEMVQK